MFYICSITRMPAPSPIRGRGAQSGGLSARFGLSAREADSDWLDQREGIDGPSPKLRTQVTEERAATILSFNQSPDIPFDRSINAYRGCEHGCAYCYARPSHAWHDLSPGLDFETKLFAKPDAARLLRQTLAKPGYKVAPIAMGTNTDPYKPIETRYRIAIMTGWRTWPPSIWQRCRSRSPASTRAFRACSSQGPARPPNGWRRCAGWPRPEFQLTFRWLR